ncbi:MAG: UvrD-helicase domain-containing protein [Rikenellaceae bacterium]|nr:UvrD-helicase domain-containing protein [Rikenellaceae bacterium]
MGQIKILSASAGSGKTYRLAYKYVETTILNPESYRHILAVTFTNKATDEMKRRILHEIDTLARGEKSDFLSDLLRDHPSLSEERICQRALEVRSRILHDYSNFAVMTIDRFFQRVVRSFMRELGVELNYTLELRTDDLLSTATDNLIEGIADNSSLEHTVDGFVEGRIDNSRHWDLRGDIARLGKQLFSDDFYASGVNIDSSEQLAEMGRQLRERRNSVRAEVVHAATDALNIIESAGLSREDFAGKSRSFVAYLPNWTSPQGTLPQLNKTVLSAIDNPDGWPNKTSPRRGDVPSVYGRVNPLIVALREGMRTLTTLEIVLRRFDEFVLLADLRKSLDTICQDQNILPISKTSRLIAGLIADSDAPFIYERVGSWYDYYMIDEFQDTSRTQWNNFLPLVAEAVSRSESQPVLLVGDVKQSIYRWRGGDWRILANDVADHFRRIAPDSIDFEPLEKNYRSFRRVVEFNNAFTGAVIRAMADSVRTTLTKAVDAGQITESLCRQLGSMIEQAYTPFAQEPNKQVPEGYATIRSYDTTDDGVPPIVERLKDLQLRGYRPEDIAILVRSNNDGYRVAEMLLEAKRQNTDPRFCFDIVTGEALRVDSSSVVQFVVACLKLSQNPDDTISAAMFNRTLGRAADAPLTDDEREFMSVVGRKSPEEAFENILIRWQLDRNSEALSYVQALHQQILSFSSGRIADIPLFVQWWEENGCKESLVMPSGTSAITIITVHKSKGLEYKAVLIPYADWEYSGGGDMMWLRSSVAGGEGAYPVTLNSASADTEFAPDYYNEVVMQAIDSLNILYVAVTRAKCELHVMLPAKPRGVGKMIMAAVGSLQQLADMGDYSCTTLNDGLLAVDYGLPTQAKHSDESSSTTIHLDSYPTHPVSAKIKLKFPSERYTEEGALSLSPRDMGVLMHRVFQDARSRAEVVEGVRRLEVDAVISSDESNTLQAQIARAFENPMVADWFSEKWQVVRAEGDILLPKDYEPERKKKRVRRPDRVMICGNRAVVVDYKFGRHKDSSYDTQIERYMNLLRDMGYAEVEGYLWYVALGEVVPF